MGDRKIRVRRGGARLLPHLWTLATLGAWAFLGASAPLDAQLPDLVDLARARSLQPVEVGRIGGHDSRATHTFSAILQAAVLPGGEVALADPATLQVRVFTQDGAFVRRMGTRGQGPGEFSFIEGLAALPDGRLFVFDGAARRLSVFSASGAHMASHGLGGTGTFVGVTDSGRLILKGSTVTPLMLMQRPAGVLCRYGSLHGARSGLRGGASAVGGEPGR